MPNNFRQPIMSLLEASSFWTSIVLVSGVVPFECILPLDRFKPMIIPRQTTHKKITLGPHKNGQEQG